jgi:hypothetical protein
MPAIIDGPPTPETPRPPLWRRLLWFFGLALGGGIATAVAAYALRLLLPSS